MMDCFDFGKTNVIPAKAGTQSIEIGRGSVLPREGKMLSRCAACCLFGVWVPAFAGMTDIV
jgi:hypothetical protein